MNQEVFDKDEYVRRVESLRPSRALTHDLELTDQDRARVDDAVASVRANGFAILPGFLDKPRLERVRNELAPIFEMTTERDADKRGR